MPNFVDGESAASVFTKINDAITIVDGLSAGDGTRVVFRSQADAQAYTTFSTAPASILLTGFTTADEFGKPRQYVLVGSEPSHGGKVTITLSGGGTVYYEPDTSTWVTPQMYGGTGQAAIVDAHTEADRVYYPKAAYARTAAMALTKSYVRVEFEPGATVSVTGGSGFMSALYEFDGVDDLEWIGGEVDCNTLSAGCLAIEANADARVKVHDLQISNAHAGATGYYWYAGGIQIWGDANELEEIDIRRCKVDGVTRATGLTNYTCSGIEAVHARRTRIIDNYVKGVIAPATEGDADGIKYFTRNVDEGSSRLSYNHGDCIISGNSVIDCNGRWLKTQARGRCVITNNRFAVDNAISSISGGGAGFIGIDDQHGPSEIRGNRFEINAAIAATGGVALGICAQRCGTANSHVGSVSNMLAGSFEGNTIYKTTASADFQQIYTLDLGPMVTAGTNWEASFKVSDNRAFTNAGPGGDHVADYFWLPNIPDFKSVGSIISLQMDNNEVDVNEWMFGPTMGFASASPAVHGGAGDHTGYLFLSFTGNKMVYDATDCAVMPYATGGIFTNDFHCQGNQIGRRANGWDAPIDFGLLRPGNAFCTGTVPSPAHVEPPAAATADITIRYFGDRIAAEWGPSGGTMYLYWSNSEPYTSASATWDSYTLT